VSPFHHPLVRSANYSHPPRSSGRQCLFKLCQCHWYFSPHHAMSRLVLNEGKSRTEVIGVDLPDWVFPHASADLGRPTVLRQVRWIMGSSGHPLAGIYSVLRLSGTDIIMRQPVNCANPKLPSRSADLGQSIRIRCHRAINLHPEATPVSAGFSAIRILLLLRHHHRLLIKPHSQRIRRKHHFFRLRLPLAIANLDLICARRKHEPWGQVWLASAVAC